MNEAVAWFTIIGAVANIAMVVAAFIALTLWRKQIAGATDHELAKKLSVALWRVDSLRTETLADLKSFMDLEGGEPYQDILVRDPLKHRADKLNVAVEKLEELEGEVAAYWGPTMHKIVMLIVAESRRLPVFTYLELHPDQENAELARLTLMVPDAVAPTITGGAYRKSLKLYTELAQQWLGIYLGRSGSRAMSNEALEARRVQVAEEARILGEGEVPAALDAKAKALADVGAALKK